MRTRVDYITGRCNYEEYYGQIARESNASEIIREAFNLEELAKKLERDAWLNNIPLSTWDFLGERLKVNWALYGDFDSKAGRVCVLKEAARILIKREEKR